MRCCVIATLIVGRLRSAFLFDVDARREGRFYISSSSTAGKNGLSEKLALTMIALSGF